MDPVFVVIVFESIELLFKVRSHSKVHLGQIKEGPVSVALHEELRQEVEELVNRIKELAEKSRLRRVYR